MKFLISMHINPAVLDALTDEEKAAIGTGHGRFIAELKQVGRADHHAGAGRPVSRPRWCRSATVSRS